MKNTDRIREELERQFVAATRQGKSSITIVARELHESVDFAHGTHPNQMPSVCNIMRENLKATDKILHETPSGKSTTFEIEYMLPR